MNKRIGQAIDLLKNNYGYTQASLVKELKHSGIEISAPTLSRLLNDANYNRIKANETLEAINHILLSKDWFYNHVDKKYYSLNASDKAVDKQVLFFNTNWYLYCYERQKDKQAGIAKLLVHIKSNGLVYCQNIARPDKSDYEGTFLLHKSKTHLFLNLKTTETSEKRLVVNLIVNEGQLYNLNLGIYTNIGANGAVFCGTIILQRIPDGHKLETPKFFSYGSKAINEIHPAIRKFFRNKWQNELKVRTGISSLDDLEEFHKQNSNKLFLNASSIKEYDVYISCPVRSVGRAKKIKKNIEMVGRVITLLQHTGLKKIYFGDKDLNPDKSELLPEVGLKRSTDAIEKSRCFVLIYTDASASSALVELGFALQFVPVIIFTEENESKLPYIVQNAYNSNKFSVKIIVYKEVEHLLELIKENGEELFLTP